MNEPRPEDLPGSQQLPPSEGLIDPEQIDIDGMPEGAWMVAEVEDTAGRLHFILGREVTDEQIAAYREALAFVLERQEQPALRLVVGNYQVYRALEASLVIASATLTPPRPATGRLAVPLEARIAELAD